MSRENLIVDASAFLAVILEEPEKASILEGTTGANLKVPGCLQWEVGNAFSAMVKRGRLSIEHGLEALRIFDQIPYQEIDVNLVEALQIANRHGIYAYDAYYLAAAKTHRLKLLTLDRKMQQVAEKEGIKTKDII